ncbi:uncharacterized protein [Hyperolius riggenbachi]|uniref:uncharacterized protein n=1 Tax=Hyperolius riggenbachi TaxID=752182 RepID=UPI0035A278E5
MSGHKSKWKKINPKNGLKGDALKDKATDVFLVFIFYVTLMTSVIHCLTVTVQAEETNLNSEVSMKEKTLSRGKGYSYEEFFKESTVDTTNDIVGCFCLGSDNDCCLQLFFQHNTNIGVQAVIESRNVFTKLTGQYIHNEITGNMNCSLTEFNFWYVQIKGNDSAVWSGNFTKGTGSEYMKGENGEKDVLLSEGVMVFLFPDSNAIKSDAEGDINRFWRFQISRGEVVANIKVNLTVTNIEYPEIKVMPRSLEIREGYKDIQLICNTSVLLPPNATLTWSKNNEFLGNFYKGNIHVINQGAKGSVKWINSKLVYSLNEVAMEDNGTYKCCISLQGFPTKCDMTQITVKSPERTICNDKKFYKASPFQFNHFQTKPLLREGRFVIIVWKFNISSWKISTRYPICQNYLANSIHGMEQWFENSFETFPRNKRGILEGILGGAGTIGAITNSLDVKTLKYDLETVGLLGGKGLKVQRNINQLMEHMIIQTASVLGSSVSHLQDIALMLIDSEQKSQLARICLETQTEYSTNFKIIAQAFQGGITPLGILRNLPKKYKYALNHIDLWINKWYGCNQYECISTSMIPIAGKEQILVPVTILGVPVSNAQLLYYQMFYNDFAMDENSDNVDQLDLSSCLHFQSKVICLPNQGKSIYHSCYHNQSLCTARIERVNTHTDLITHVEQRKICFQVMSSEEMVKGHFKSCVHSEKLVRGLYCVEGDINAVSLNDLRINITSLISEDVDSLPIQYNVSQINEFPWDKWTQEIIKDKGLLLTLTKELHAAEIKFNHQQGILENVEHDFITFSIPHRQNTSAVPLSIQNKGLEFTCTKRKEELSVYTSWKS